MYVLDKNNGSIAPGNKLCNVQTRRSYGCTFYEDDPNYEYPFLPLNPVSLSIENGTQGYLRNVVPQELDPGHALSSVTAQAIAARTYVFRHIDEGLDINNSSQFQVYIPYRYDALPSYQKERLEQALQDKSYLSLPGSSDPIWAYFTEDNDEWTAWGSESYLRSVYDPISQAEGQDKGHNLGGMGSAAAGRWGAGHTDEYGREDRGDAWSVRWDRGEQIAAHYYSGVTFIGSSLNPPDTLRFNALTIDRMPTGNWLRQGRTYDIDLRLQNTGANDWDVFATWPEAGIDCPASGHPTSVSYHFYHAFDTGQADGNPIACGDPNAPSGNPCFEGMRTGLCLFHSDSVSPGSWMSVPDVALRVPDDLPGGGSYWLRWDLVRESITWSSRLQLNPYQAQWPTQDLLVTIGPYGHTPPTNLNSPSHVAGDWSNNANVTLTWSAGDDPIGVADYRYRWPGLTGWQSTGSTQVTTGLPDGEWNFELYSVANDGETSDVIGYGPFRIDTVNPTAVLAFDPPWVTATPFPVDWSASYDGGPGGLRFDVDYVLAAQSDWTGWLADTPQSSASFNGQDDATYSFRVRARDQAGNQSAWRYATVSVRTHPYLALHLTPRALLDWTVVYSNATPRTGQLQIANEGGGELSWTLATDPDFPWLTLGSATPLPAGGATAWTIPVTLTHAPETGLYPTQITVTAQPEARWSPAVLDVTINVVDHLDYYLPIIAK